MSKIVGSQAAITILSAVLAVVVPDAETKILAFCMAGAAAGGLVGVNISTEANPLTPRARVTRWLTNFAAGAAFGPLLTEYAVGSWFRDARPAYVALAAGGACGVAAVGAICIAVPAVLKWITSKISKT